VAGLRLRRGAVLYELADAIVDVDRLRQALSQVMWASRQIEDLRDEYTTKIRNSDVDTARKHRKQAFARAWPT